MGLQLLGDFIPLFQLLLPAHPQGLGGDFLKVPLLGEEQVHRVVGHLLHDFRFLHLVGVENHGAPGLAVLLGHGLQLLDDDALHLGLGGQNALQLGDIPLQLGDLLGALEDVLPVQVAQLDFRHVLRLDLVDAKANHQVGHHLGLLLCLPDNADGLVNVQQNQLQALQEVELLPLLLQVEVGAAADALHPEGGPLLQQLPHAQHPGRPGDEHVEVAGEAVLQGGELKQLLHQLVRVGAPL